MNFTGTCRYRYPQIGPPLQKNCVKLENKYVLKSELVAHCARFTLSADFYILRNKSFEDRHLLYTVQEFIFSCLVVPISRNKIVQ